MTTRVFFLSFLFALPLSAELTSALQVRQLSAETAKEGLPVKLRATVHFIESPGTVFVQDATAGTFLRSKSAITDLLPGDVVEAEGVTFPGLFLPGVQLGSYKRVGHEALPLAQIATFDDLLAARFHYQRVKVEGIVRSVAADGENRSLLRLAMGARLIEVRVDAVASEGEVLVDALVSIEGLAAGSINDLRQLVSPYIRISSWAEITTLRSAPPPDLVPVTKTASLLQFNSSGGSGHRVRVEGEVSAAFNDGLVFIRDEGASVAIAFAKQELVHVGDRVVVQGFPVMEHYTPTLQEAQLLQVLEQGSNGCASHGLQLADMHLTTHEGDLITLRGKVETAATTGDGQRFEITDKGKSIMAHLAAGELLAIEPQSMVELTGIARIESMMGKGFNAHPQSFSLWLRDARDVRVLESPARSLWQRFLMVLSVLGVLMFAALLWILALRKQVSTLRLRIRHEGALEERQRIAREFHDTLEQELAGLSLRLDAAATRPLDDKARSLLDTSRHLVSRVQVEARNLVADLRDDPASQVELTTALHQLANQQPANAPAMHLEFGDDLPAMPPHIAHHLRMIAQEAVTNAIKHARASTITIKMQAVAGGIELQVQDDGIGFDASTSTQGQPGHFGCMGIRERCRKIGATPQWLSAPGKGTALVVVLPTVGEVPWLLR